MHPARIAELLQPFLSPLPNSCHSESDRRPGKACPERSRREPAVLPPTLLQNISTYIDLLLRWNARINLTAIRDPEEIVTRHFGESLFAARHLFPLENSQHEHNREGHDFSRADIVFGENRALAHEGLADARHPTAAVRLADLGSGAGFPGLPIKLWAPRTSITLIESNHKKAAFLREVARALTLTDIYIQNARVETLPPATFDVVTLRAVERFPKVLPVAAALLAPSGRLALLIASSQLAQAQSTVPHIAWQDQLPVPQSQSRLLLVGTLEPA